MAVAPSSPILASDMAALAALANGKTTVGLFSNGNSGTAYNTLQYVAINPASPGNGYKAGDALSIIQGGTTWGTVTVEAIGTNGTMVGLRLGPVVKWPTTGTQPTSPITLSGGSGNGAKVTFSVGTVPANVNFSFPYFSSVAGQITAPYLIAGGSGYVANDTIMAGPMQIKVNAVNGAGKILTFTYINVGLYAQIFDPLPTVPLTASGGSGSGAQFGFYFIQPNSAGWLTELGRLRRNIISRFASSSPLLRVSGPWPISGIGDGWIINGPYENPPGVFTNADLPNATNLAFYYSDTGQRESVNLFCLARVLSIDPSTIGVYTPIHHLDCQIRVCAPGPVHLVGSFSFTCAGYGAGSASSPLPISWTVGSITDGVYNIIGTIDAVVNPGTYTLSCDAPNPDYCYYHAVSSIGILMTLQNPLSNSAPAPGINQNASVLCITIPNSFDGTSPFTIQSNSGPTYGGWYDGGGCKIQTSTLGLFTGITEPVSSLNPVSFGSMPWNLTRHATVSPYPLINPMLPSQPVGSGVVEDSYIQTLPCESQGEPPQWVASRNFTLGFTILDSNGNFQTVTTAGTSAGGSPAWKTVAGQQTVDGTVKWNCSKVLKPANAIIPATHRSVGVPKYPVYWFSETNPALKPPVGGSELTLTIWGSGNQWQNNTWFPNHVDAGWQQSNLALGWWIYGVAINRLGTAANVSLPKTGAAAVTIGCIRNGAFVAFGTYNTGQKINVLWPIFTSDALVYQCSERVDVQAVAIASGSDGVAIGAGVGYPICATYYNDTVALLSQIS